MQSLTDLRAETRRPHTLRLYRHPPWPPRQTRPQDETGWTGWQLPIFTGPAGCR